MTVSSSEKEPLISSSPTSTDFDTIIIGAGISGINAAYRTHQSFPNSTYTILESRYGIGGTWDFFRYPGIRSDSDLHTFGFPWRPWSEQKVIADGESIREYINDTARIEGIAEKVRFGEKVVQSEWNSEKQYWTLSVERRADATSEKVEEKTYTARFVILATGYYDYEEPLPATITGVEDYKGTIVHPQFWPQDLDYKGKDVVIIGSGATAVTLLPSLAENGAGHVTMLQRSPSYILALPNPTNRESQWLYRLLPTWMYLKIQRWKFIIQAALLFNFCQMFPNAAKKVVRNATKALLPKNIPLDPHFEPTYNPWEQRLCFCPDGDFFKALSTGTASVSTGTIKSISNKTITLHSGETIHADILVTATGLKMRMAGGAKLIVDGKEIVPSEKFLWKGVLMQDVPNIAIVIGYTNASWTLGADATAVHVNRLRKHMAGRGYASVTPRVPSGAALKDRPLLNLNSTYISRAKNVLPRAGDSGPWKPRTGYVRDMFQARFGDISDGLEFVGERK